MSLVQHHGLTKLYTSALLHTILDDITIVSYSDKLNKKEDKKIPIYMISPDNRSNSKIYKDVANSLPAMILSITGIERNIERQRNKLLRRKSIIINNIHAALFSYNDIPYDIRYNLDIVAPNQSVLFEILEHILGFFHDGKYYINVVLPLYQSNYYSCPVTIESQDVTIEQANDDYFSTGTIQASIQFVVKGIFHSFIDLISYERVLNDNNGKITNDNNPLKNMTEHEIRKIILGFVNCREDNNNSKDSQYIIEVKD